MKISSSSVNTLDGRKVIISGHPGDVDRITEIMQAVGLDANLDCLVQHPADEPPDDKRGVLSLLDLGDTRRLWIINHCISGEWVYNNNSVVMWQELPPLVRSNDE